MKKKKSQQYFTHKIKLRYFLCNCNCLYLIISQIHHKFSYKYEKMTFLTTGNLGQYVLNGCLLKSTLAHNFCGKIRALRRQSFYYSNVITIKKHIAPYTVNCTNLFVQVPLGEYYLHASGLL